jgi:hypothetical protein
MTDAPETIWARPDPYEPDWTGDKTLRSKSHVEYRRADLPPTTAQLMSDPRVKALVEALEKIQRETVRCRGDQSYRDACKMAFSLTRTALAQLKEIKE